MIAVHKNCDMETIAHDEHSCIKLKSYRCIHTDKSNEKKTHTNGWTDKIDVYANLVFLVNFPNKAISGFIVIIETHSLVSGESDDWN